MIIKMLTKLRRKYRNSVRTSTELEPNQLKNTITRVKNTL